jgi:hypothetical protein
MFIKQVFLLLVFVSATSRPISANAEPFCPGKTEKCDAARRAAALSPHERKFTLDCEQCRVQADKKGYSFGAQCGAECAEAVYKIWR